MAAATEDLFASIRAALTPMLYRLSARLPTNDFGPDARSIRSLPAGGGSAVGTEGGKCPGPALGVDARTLGDGGLRS